MPATQSSAAAWKMSVPTIFAAVSGKTSSITSPKKVPLPTEVSPTMKPPLAPIATAMTLSRSLSRNGAVRRLGAVTNVFAEEAEAAEDQRHADHLRRTRLDAVPYCLEPLAT